MPKIKVKHEERFVRIGRRFTNAKPNDLGRTQFVADQSRGIKPDTPDPYYVTLSVGKRWWDWTVEQWRQLYLSSEWPGWFQVERDFLDQPDEFNHIFHWYTTKMFPGAQSIFEAERT